MTDRLATLMRSEVDALDVPNPPALEILTAGRRIRRRSTAQRRSAIALAAVVVAGATAVALHGGGTDQAAPAVAQPTPLTAYAVDDTVYLDDAITATMPEVAQTLYYTSAGVLVRTNKDGSSDGGAPFHFELVEPDGTTTKLGVTLGDVAPSVDPAQPYLAWATMTGGRIQVVVHDVTADRDVATVDVPGEFTWGGWEAPPVSLSGDYVYVGTDHKTQVVNWHTGDATTTDAVPGSTFPDVHGGYTTGGGSESVVDARTGKTVLDLSAASSDVRLSPDGSHAMGRSAGRTDIYALPSGPTVHLPSGDWGWSSTGDHVFQVHGSTMTTCITSTGQCHDSSVPPLGSDAFVRYAGMAFES
jgi:hypothetical protein